MSEQPVQTVDSNDGTKFEQACAALIADGYTLSSSSCGFVNSERYDFCQSWMAIFVKYDQEPKPVSSRLTAHIIELAKTSDTR